MQVGSTPSQGAPLALPSIIRHALDYGTRSEMHRRKQEAAAKQLELYLIDRHGTAQISWPDFVAGDYVEEYADYLVRERRMAINTVRQYTNPIRLANKYMRKKHRAETVEVQEHIPKRRPLPKTCLTGQQLATVIREARRTGNVTAELGFVVGGFAGLNLEEICFLSERDLEGDLLFVYESKNDYRERILPVVPLVRDVVRRALILRAEKPRIGDGGRNALFSNYNFLASAMRRVMRRCAEAATTEEDRESFTRCKPMNARKAFDNIVLSAGCPMHWKEGYMGHKLAGEADSYDVVRVTRQDLLAVRKQCCENLRREVVARVQAVVESLGL